MHPFSEPFEPNIADQTAEQAEATVKRTSEVLSRIDTIRKKLELPLEQLPLVVAMYGKAALALSAEDRRKQLAERTQRLPLTLQSEDRLGQPWKVQPTQVRSVTVGPQCVFRPEDISIHGDRSRWLIHNIKIGNREQRAGGLKPVPGAEFGPGGVCASLRLDTCQAGMDLTLVVEYVGPEPDGEVFEATIVGTTVEY